MYRKKIVKIFFILFLLIIIFLIYIKYNKNEKIDVKIEQNNTDIYNSNIIKDVEYKTQDKNGNEYLIKSKKGEIDFSNPNIVFLTDVYALIKIKNSEEITVVSDFGKYNSENYDIIFSKKVIIKYLNNKITGEYLDLSLERNSMIISKNVFYSGPENILKADVIEMDIRTKDTKIFMHEQNKDVNISSKN